MSEAEEELEIKTKQQVRPWLLFDNPYESKENYTSCYICGDIKRMDELERGRCKACSD